MQHNMALNLFKRTLLLHRSHCVIKYHRLLFGVEWSTGYWTW